MGARGARVPVDDWGFRYGWGAFETIRVHQRRPLFLGEHLDRLYRTAAQLQLADRFPCEDWVRDVSRTIRGARLAEGVVNLYWTIGVPKKAAGCRLAIARHTDVPVGRPVRLWLAPWRIEPTAPGVGSKTMAYFPNIFASVCSWAEGFDSALVLNTEGNVSDGATSTLFAVKGGTLCTPPLSDGALDGITRRILIDACRSLGIPFAEAHLTPSVLCRAPLVFITSAVRGIARVSRIEDRVIGPATKSSTTVLAALRRAYKQRIRLEIDAVPPAF